MRKEEDVKEGLRIVRLQVFDTASTRLLLEQRTQTVTCARLGRRVNYNKVGVWD